MSAHDHKRVTSEGRKLGENLARMAEPEIARLAAEGEPDERCASCAFRRGTVPNGCPQTGLDAIKAVAEGVPFYCHATKIPCTNVCHGWFAAVRVVARSPFRPLMAAATQKYDFSPPDVDVDELLRQRIEPPKEAS